MRIIKEPTVRLYWLNWPDVEPSLARWLDVARRATWRSIDDVRKDFPHADAAKVASGNTVTVFNIAGNKYRLVAAIHYRFGVVYVRDFMTHARYSKDAWKQRH